MSITYVPHLAMEPGHMQEWCKLKFLVATIGKSSRLPHSGEGEVGARVKHTQHVELCKCTAVYMLPEM